MMKTGVISISLAVLAILAVFVDPVELMQEPVDKPSSEIPELIRAPKQAEVEPAAKLVASKEIKKPQFTHRTSRPAKLDLSLKAPVQDANPAVPINWSRRANVKAAEQREQKTAERLVQMAVIKESQEGSEKALEYFRDEFRELLGKLDQSQEGILRYEMAKLYKRAIEEKIIKLEPCPDDWFENLRAHASRAKELFAGYSGREEKIREMFRLWDYSDSLQRMASLDTFSYVNLYSTAKSVVEQLSELQFKSHQTALQIAEQNHGSTSILYWKTDKTYRYHELSDLEKSHLNGELLPGMVVSVNLLPGVKASKLGVRKEQKWLTFIGVDLDGKLRFVEGEHCGVGLDELRELYPDHRIDLLLDPYRRM